MPLYEYQCDACATRFERIQKFSDPPVETCPACSGVVRKLVSSPAIQFKGSGWYITDYAKKPAGKDGKDKDGGKTGGDGGTASSTSSTDKPAAGSSAESSSSGASSSGTSSSGAGSTSTSS